MHQVGSAARATTPADISAKNGTAIPDEIGDSRCSSRSAGLRVLALVRAHPRQQAEDDTGDGGVDPALVHAATRRRRPAAGRRSGVRTRSRCSTAQAAKPPAPPGASHARCRRRGVEDRDDHDHDQVVDDREREQEGPQRRRQVRPDHGQHRQRERDVGRRRDRPALGVVRPGRDVDGQVDQRRDRHPADRGHHRHGGVGRPAQRAHHELALQLEPGHEEEQGQRTVGRPVLDVERPDLRARAGRRTTRPTASSPRPRRPPRPTQGDRAADGLAAEQVAEEGALGDDSGRGRAGAGGRSLVTMAALRSATRYVGRSEHDVPTRLPGSPQAMLPTRRPGTALVGSAPRQPDQQRTTPAWQPNRPRHPPAPRATPPSADWSPTPAATSPR